MKRSCTREETPYTWRVSCGMPAYAALAGVRFDRLFREAEAIIEAFTVGEPLARKLFGPDLNYGGPTWAGISYGHINGLGSQLRFAQDSEIAHTPIYDSMAAGIEALQQEVDWRSTGMMPFYLDLWAQLKSAFPDRHIGFGGFGLEGPITTAWEVRGHDFFMDYHDDPERYKVFLRLLTESIVSYAKFMREVNGQPAVVNRVGLYDDIASLISPRLWPEMVLPFHEQFFQTQLPAFGHRHAHIENLVPDHLPHLDTLGLDSFDPSVVSKITPADLRVRCRVPFSWRLNSMHVRDLSCQEIRHFVFAAIADGASGVFSHATRTTTSPQHVKKIHTFIEAAQEVGQLLADGCPRRQLKKSSH